MSTNCIQVLTTNLKNVSQNINTSNVLPGGKDQGGQDTQDQNQGAPLESQLAATKTGLTNADAKALSQGKQSEARRVEE